MDDGSPTLEVGFSIDTADSFANLEQLSSMMDSVEQKIVAEAASIERATGSMLNLGDQTASVSAFASTTSAAFNKAEQAAERLTAKYQEQTATLGMTRAAAIAYRAEQVGATDAAIALRDAEAALNAARAANARQFTVSAGAAAGLAGGVAEVGRSSQAASIEMLEMTHIARSLTEQIASGVSPFRALTLESGRLMTAIQYGGAGVGGFVKQFASMLGIIRTVQDAELAEAAATSAAQATAISAVADRVKAGIAAAEIEAELALAADRVAVTDIEAAAAAAQLIAAREAQAVGTRQLAVAEDALAVAQGRAAEAAEASAAATSTSIGAVGAVLAPLTVIAGVAFGAFKQFQDQVKDSGELTAYRNSLGLTHKEMLELSDGTDKVGDKVKQLTDVTVTAGDVMSGLWKTIEQGASVGNTWDELKSSAATAFGYVLEAWNATSAGITAGIYGTFTAVKTVWSSFPAVFGDLFTQGVNAAIDALNKLVQVGVDGLNGLIAAADKVPGVNIGQISAPQLAPIDNANAGAAAKAAKEIGDGYTKAYADARKADAAFWKQVGDNAKQSAKDRLKAEADALKANRTPTKPKVDHAALNAEAIEAQITNLYKLADAYGVSGAAALIAEAREKAESKAIKDRGDIEAAVDRQIRLSIAQRVADAAKSAAAMTDQAAVYEAVNAQVAAGIVPASQANQLIQDRLALLPLQAARQAALEEAAEAAANGETARQAQYLAAAAKAQDAIDRETAAQQRLNKAKVDAQFQTVTATGDDQIAQLQMELQLIGATDAARVHALATLKAEQEAARALYDPEQTKAYVQQQVEIADKQQAVREATAQLNGDLRLTAELADSAADSMSKAFGKVGDSIGGVIKVLGEYGDKQAAIDKLVSTGQLTQAQGAQKSADLQISNLIGITDAAKSLFATHSAGYQAMAAAEKALAVIQAVRLAGEIKADALEAVHTASSIARSVARTAAKAVEAVVTAISSLPFPLNLAAGAATIAALAAIGVEIAGSLGGGSSAPTPANTGTGTVLGDSSAASDSIKNGLADLKNVDTTTSVYARQMAASLSSIDNQIGSFAALVARTDNINASAGVNQGFQTNTLGSILSAPAKLLSNIPVIGSIFGAIGNFIGSLFGTKTQVTGTGLYGAPQTLGAIDAGGYTAQNYSDIEKTSKFFGITTGHSYSTQYAAADPQLNEQFTLILKSFNQAIAAAAGPLGDATDAVQAKLNSFVVDIGKIDLSGLSGTDIQTKLENIFGALGDQLATYVFPEITQFQKVGEGALETLTRVASTVEAVTNSLDELGISSQSLGIAAKMGLADQFDSLSDMQSETDAYFSAFYTQAEQATAKAAQLGQVFTSLGLTMPTTLDGFRQLVDAQDLTTSAGQATYAALIKLAPAFADLQNALNGSKSAADVASEKLDLQKQLLEAQGDTAGLRALELQDVDASNRALQQQVWAVQDAKDAADAASQLADAWKSVGDDITTEIERIRGLSSTGTSGSFAQLLGQFNAATTAARSGDQDAAKSLPGLSQSLLTAAAASATSAQELARVQAQTAASLQTTNDAISALAGAPAATTSGATVTSTNAALLSAAATTAQATAAPAAANDDLTAGVQALEQEVANMRTESAEGMAQIAGYTAKVAKILDAVTQPSGGTAVSIEQAA